MEIAVADRFFDHVIHGDANGIPDTHNVSYTQESDHEPLERNSQMLTKIMKRLAILIGLLICSSGLAANKSPNILFIAVDDLRPQLGCYGKSEIHSPNIDRLAASGVVFNRAYCMVPTCGASRASLMTGIRPSPKRFVNYLASAEKDAPGITTLNTHFKNHGYFTISNGKVFHNPADNALGWSEPAWRPKGVATYAAAENQRLASQRAQELGRRGRGPAFESAEVSDDAYGDGQLPTKPLPICNGSANKISPSFWRLGSSNPIFPS